MSCHSHVLDSTSKLHTRTTSIFAWIEGVISSASEHPSLFSSSSPPQLEAYLLASNSQQTPCPTRLLKQSSVNPPKPRNILNSRRCPEARDQYFPQRSALGSPLPLVERSTNLPTIKRRKRDHLPLETDMDGDTGNSETGFLTPRSKSDNSSIAKESFKTPTRSNSSILGLKPRNTPDAVGRNMARHGLLQNDRALRSYPDFHQKIKDIVESTRTSAVSVRSISKFENRHRAYARMNETTLLQNLFPVIMRDGYTLAHEYEGLGKEEMDTLRKGGKIYRDFLDDEKVITTMDREFVRTLLPSRHATQEFEAEIAKDLEKQSGMKNPKPDILYGIETDKFPVPSSVHIPAEVTALLEISPSMHHPFFLLEGKADRGSMAEAENQARRAGATLVNAARSLAALVYPKPSILGPDETSFVFSATMGPKHLEIWVHWFEARENDIDSRYHMDIVASDTLAIAGNIEGIRRKLHNIVEWGANNRYIQYSSLHTKIHEYAIKSHQSTVERTKGSKKRKQSTISSFDDEDGQL